MTKVYLVWEDESLYGVFSTEYKAKRWIYNKLKREKSPWIQQMLKQQKHYAHLFEIEPKVVDSEVNEFK